jgi:hypothetical protein
MDRPSLTRDEHRAACIEAVERAIIAAIIDAGGTIDVQMHLVAIAAFDAAMCAAITDPPKEKP